VILTTFEQDRIIHVSPHDTHFDSFRGRGPIGT
jgi:hypothetical protein